MMAGYSDDYHLTDKATDMVKPDAYQICSVVVVLPRNPLIRNPFTAQGQVEGHIVEVVRSTGSTGCFVARYLVKRERYTGRTIHVKEINGSICVPEAKVSCETPFYSGTVLAAVLDQPPIDFIVGNIPGIHVFPRWVQTHGRRKGTAPPPVATPGDLKNADVIEDQLADDTLGGIYHLARETKSFDKGNRIVQYLMKRSRIYRQVTLKAGEAKLQFIVPGKYRTAIFKMGHELAMSGHMGNRQTLNSIQASFFWPNMEQDIMRMCRSCNVCQRITDKERTQRAPLEPIPVIPEPFERVTIDLVGPVNPRAADGSMYILTLVDIASRWPEAVPLKNIATTTVAEALFQVFRRVGIPKEVFSDRGSLFTSEMMDEVHRLLTIKGLRTTPYHPMYNSLCGRVDVTLKNILKRATAEERREWPQYIAPLLFAYREAPQSDLELSPFELLYGRAARGPLQVLRHLWDGVEEASPEVRTMYQNVIEMGECLQATCKFAKEELLKAQEVEKHCDRKTELRKLQVGDQCLVLLPTNYNKLLVQWKGPYSIRSCPSDTDYTVHMGDQVKRFHINMLKKYCNPNITCAPQPSSCLTEEQLECLELVRGHFVSCRDPKITIAATVIADSSEAGQPLAPELCRNETGDNVHINTKLCKWKTRLIREVIREYDEVFSDVPRVASVEPYKIKLTDKTPVRSKPYPIPYKFQEAVSNEIAAMEEAGIIEPSTSPYCSPTIVVDKKDEGVRLCGDFRKLNAVTVFDAEPMPDQESIMCRLTGSTIFTKMDLTEGFFQIPLHPESRKLTAISTPKGLFHFLVLPFGLSNSSAAFIRTTRKVLGDIAGVEIFMGNVLIHNNSFEYHVARIRQVLQRLKYYNMTVKPSKCDFAQDQVEFLGHVIGNGVKRCREDKLIRIKDVPRPATKKQVRSFLGLVEYYRSFIANFAVIALPLQELLQKHLPEEVLWTSAQEQAFQELKLRLLLQPVLHLPNLNKEFTLRTDAYPQAIAAILMQETDGEIYPVACFSRKLKPAEKNYSTVEKELLAVVEGIRKFYSYLSGSPFLLDADHLSLSYLRTSKNANARLMRWALYLQQFRFSIKYTKGLLDTGVDDLSSLKAAEDVDHHNP